MLKVGGTIAALAPTVSYYTPLIYGVLERLRKFEPFQGFLASLLLVTTAKNGKFMSGGQGVLIT